MAQHDYVLENASGALFRQDLNNALKAIAENNMGATAPTTTYAGMWWLDTSTSPATLRIRNNTNSAWVSCGNLNEMSYLAGVTSGIQTQLNAKAASSASTALGTSFTASGNIAATTVQAAIQELDSEKVGLSGDQTIGGVKVFSDRMIKDSSQVPAIANAGTSYNQLEISNGGNASASATLAFHRSNSFACYLGLDTDNKLKIGGWSFGNTAHLIWHNAVMNQSLNTPSGYIVFPNNMVMQWFETGYIASDATATLTYPVAMSKVLAITPSIVCNDNGNDDVFARLTTITNTQCVVKAETAGTSLSAAHRFIKVFALGVI